MPSETHLSSHLNNWFTQGLSKDFNAEEALHFGASPQRKSYPPVWSWILALEANSCEVLSHWRMLEGPPGQPLWVCLWKAELPSEPAGLQSQRLNLWKHTSSWKMDGPPCRVPLSTILPLPPALEPDPTPSEWPWKAFLWDQMWERAPFSRRRGVCHPNPPARASTKATSSLTSLKISHTCSHTHNLLVWMWSCRHTRQAFILWLTEDEQQWETVWVTQGRRE